MIVAYVASDRKEGQICAEGPFLSHLSSTSSSPLSLKRHNRHNENIATTRFQPKFSFLFSLVSWFQLILWSQTCFDHLLTQNYTQSHLMLHLQTSADLLSVFFNFKLAPSVCSQINSVSFEYVSWTFAGEYVMFTIAASTDLKHMAASRKAGCRGTLHSLGLRPCRPWPCQLDTLRKASQHPALQR